MENERQRLLSLESAVTLLLLPPTSCGKKASHQKCSYSCPIYPQDLAAQSEGVVKTPSYAIYSESSLIYKLLIN